MGFGFSLKKTLTAGTLLGNQLAEAVDGPE